MCWTYWWQLCGGQALLRPGNNSKPSNSHVFFLSDSQRHTDTELLLDDSMWTTCWTLSNIIPNRKRRTSPQHSTAVICYLFPFCDYIVVCFLKIFYIVFMYSFVSTYVHILNKWLVRGQVCMLYYLHIFALLAQGVSCFKSIKLMLKGQRMEARPFWIINRFLHRFHCDRFF